MKRALLPMLLVAVLLGGRPVLAVDPLYEPQLEHLSQVLGTSISSPPSARPAARTGGWR